jgi:hypothetical protein
MILASDGRPADEMIAWHHRTIPEIRLLLLTGSVIVLAGVDVEECMKKLGMWYSKLQSIAQ